MENLTQFAAAGCRISEEMIETEPGVSLRLITFTPARPSNKPAVVFVPGWISLIQGWKEVLREMTHDFPVYYLETREKISSRVTTPACYSVEEIGRDVATLVRELDLTAGEYILFGSSLGATALLDCCRFLDRDPLALVLIGPNAVFRVPWLGLQVVRIFYPGLYLLIKPVVKWYLRTFRLDVQSDYAQYQKYCNALDAADPWKLKKGALALATYQVWDLLPDISYPTLIFGASRDVLHEPENLQKIVQKMPRATYLDLETNRRTHTAEMVEEMRRYLAGLHQPAAEGKSAAL